MSENLAGLIKILGITLLLFVLWGMLAIYTPSTFLASNNIENLMRRTALYGVLGIGVAFVIISSGIDLSIGSLVCLSACLLGSFLRVDYVATGTTDVWNVEMATKTLIVSDQSGFQVGDHVWYEKDRRNRSLLEIKSISSLEGTPRRFSLIVSGDLKRDQQSVASQPVAQISKAFAVKSVADSRVGFELGFPNLNPRDKISFVHPTASNREKVVARVESTGIVSLAETAAGLDESFFAVPILRRPLMSIPVAIISVLAISVLLGFIHGLLITQLNLQPFVVTLCGLMIYRGLSRSLTNDQTVGFIEYQESLGKIATGRWELWPASEGIESFGIPYSFFIFLLFTMLALVLLNLTVWGRHLLAVGRNVEATRYSGINSNRIIWLTYIICAGLAGIGGMMFAIDSNSIAPSAFGNFLELYAIAAAVLGGCSLRGGTGSILGVVVGTALMQTLYNAIILLKIPDESEFTIIGAVILFGVISDELLHRTAVAFKANRAAATQS